MLINMIDKCSDSIDELMVINEYLAKVMDYINELKVKYEMF